ncbi:MAG: type I phosphomannose isomerase catalytic subunit [bacterium]
MKRIQESDLYPLKFKEVLRTYSFGGQKIYKFKTNNKLPREQIAETWEVCDHETDISRVKNGPWAGKSIRGLIWVLREKLLGERVYNNTGNYFPLLLKLLDAERTLGLQIHPDDDFVQKNNLDQMGKAELYYIIDCDQDSYVHWGVKNQVTIKEMIQAITKGEGIELTKKVPVNPGDVIYVPAGWIHAIGPGILMIELQQNSDITIGQKRVSKSMGSEVYTLYQGQKTVDMFKEQMKIEQVPEEEIKIDSLCIKQETGIDQEYLFASKHFAVEKLLIKEKSLFSSDRNKFFMYTVIAGKGKLKYDNGQEKINKGETIFIPAGLGNYQIIPEKELSIIKSYVPDLEVDIINPLKERGFSDEKIKQLGGFSSYNDILNLL